MVALIGMLLSSAMRLKQADEIKRNKKEKKEEESLIEKQLKSNTLHWDFRELASGLVPMID